MIRKKIWSYRIKAAEAFDSRDYQKTITYCNSLLSLKSIDKDTQSVAFVMKGESHEKLGNIQRALFNYDKALQIIGVKPKIKDRKWRVVMLRLRGGCYKALGKYAKALRDFEEMTILDDKKFSGLLESAEVYIEISQFAKAKEKLKQVLEVTKGWPNESLWRNKVKELSDIIKAHE